MAGHHPIRAVARLTGLSIDTLRAWERRYQAVTPVRDDRGRLYTSEHVERLKLLAALVEGGHGIGRIARLPNAALHRLSNTRGAAPATARVSTAIDLAPLLTAARQYDLPGVEAALSRQALLLPPSQFVFEIVLPLLREAGARWESGHFRPSHEHLLSVTIRNVLGGMFRTMPPADRRDGIVMASLSGERHELGLLCAAVLAATAGLNVTYLGPDLPAADVAHAVAQASARIVLTSVTLRGAVAATEWKALSRLPERVQLWVGGPHAAEARQILKTRARVIASLEDLQPLLASHGR